MINTARFNISVLIDRYKGYINNLQWDLTVNGEFRSASDIEKFKDRIEVYREVIRDLESL